MSRALAFVLASASACAGHHLASGGGGGGGDAIDPDGVSACTLDVSLAQRLGHNTSANAAYDRAHFAANFGTATWIAQSGATMPVDPAVADLSLNPVTPGHVSNVDVHALVPSRPDLRWFAHSVPW